jgi:hypothetical protein
MSIGKPTQRTVIHSPKKVKHTKENTRPIDKQRERGRDKQRERERERQKNKKSIFLLLKGSLVFLALSGNQIFLIANLYEKLFPCKNRW